MFAWISLTRLCGCNYKQPVFNAGPNSVRVEDPQQPGKWYRLARAKFEQGVRQFRDSWCIEKWSEKAARTTESEKGWLD